MSLADEQTWQALGTGAAPAQAAFAVLDHLAPLFPRLCSSIFAAALLPAKAGRASTFVSPAVSMNGAATHGAPAEHLLTSLARQSIRLAPYSKQSTVGMSSYLLCIPLLWER